MSDSPDPLADAADLLRAAGWEVTPPPEPPTLAERLANASGMYVSSARNLVDKLRLVSLDDAERVEVQRRTQLHEMDTWHVGSFNSDTHQRMVIYMPATPIGDES